MKKSELPLTEISIQQLFNGDSATYEVPIYQRNYAWGKEEIHALVQDVFDSYVKAKNSGISDSAIYYIGTLVSFHKGDRVYEVIDGQQRLTTISILLKAMNIHTNNKLTFRARKKSNDTIAAMPEFDEVENIEPSIKSGYDIARAELGDIVGGDKKRSEEFKNYFCNNVHIIHYQVPKNIDLNHYFEVMNSRGEQLEKHEIVKAWLLAKLSKNDGLRFSRIWESCSDMGIYVQRKYPDRSIFGPGLDGFIINCFDEVPQVVEQDAFVGKRTIEEMCVAREAIVNVEDKGERADAFQPIIDFSNFLLIVLKLTRIQSDKDFVPTKFNLDDKELLNEFKNIEIDGEFAKLFAFNLLKAKFFLDNYIVHHSNEEDKADNKPWCLEKWHKEQGRDKNYGRPKRLTENETLVQLLSMFEVSFTARQRKNYLFYCILYLFKNGASDIDAYVNFAEKLAEKYYKDVYLDSTKLNEKNTPLPGSFDSVILVNGDINVEIQNEVLDFDAIYGNGAEKTKGIPLFIFNYLDYKLWKKYNEQLKGEKEREDSPARREFFDKIGCSDFGLEIFRRFYFSRTRRSLEHYYAQAYAKKNGGEITEAQINCFGNFAMIGSEANSSGSDWSPVVKLDHYLDESKKISPVSVASLKFMVMMQKCKDNAQTRMPGQQWNFQDIKEHQSRMVELLND